ncbi:hypothetical protein NDI49_19325 [Trichocoleus sp. ST-U3]
MSNYQRQRVDKAYELLLRLTAENQVQGHISEWTPAWSSAYLEKTVEEILTQPQSTISDLFRGLWKLLAQTNATLTTTMAHFLRDIVVLCFTQYRELYDVEDFEWMTTLVNDGCSEAQAYLSLYALPDQWIGNCHKAILAALEGTDFITEARQQLSE